VETVEEEERLRRVGREGRCLRRPGAVGPRTPDFGREFSGGGQGPAARKLPAGLACLGRVWVSG